MIIEDRFFELVENVLCNKITITEAHEKYNSWLEKESDINYSKINCIKRMFFSFRLTKETDTGWSDFIANLHMLILSFNRKIMVSPFIRDGIIKNIKSYNLYLSEESNGIYVTVLKSKIDWIENTDDMYSVFDFSKTTLSASKRAQGDGRLKNFTGFNQYSCNAQKLIIRALDNQIGGTTILATMPTGGGKSLPCQFVSFYEESGTTIVVVPTIALAIDQNKSASKYFKGDRKVRSYYDGISKNEKLEIFNELKNNKISLLYLSPETVLNGSFYDVIVEAAKNGIINRLVVDEAHIVAQWGEFFRTEFQFLSIFRRKLLEITEGKLKTVLLSATVTDNTELLLKKLYSEEGKFIQIRGDALRNELTYYISRCENDVIRKRRVLEIIDNLPRPLIIYVPVIEKAKEYCELLKEKGYAGVRTFTSETSSNDRIKILNDWDNDALDIIVATSAFGMGVNKKEVRAIIHTFIPENIDRFYQEVGRAGRDKYNALSFIFTSFKDDEDYIKFFTRSRVLTVDNIISRWKVILDENKEQISGDKIWVAVEAVPDKLKDNIGTGSLNVSWNEYVILFLYKQGIIELIDMKIDSETNNRRILIKLVKLELINDINELYKYLEPIRAAEREIVNNEIYYIKEMIKNEKFCWCQFFKNVYNLTESKCNGCPVCRKKGAKKYTQEDIVQIVENKNLLRESFLVSREQKKSLLVLNNDYISSFKEILKECHNNYIDCLIIDSTNNFEYSNWDIEPSNKLFIFNYEDLIDNNEYEMIYGNVAVIYGSNDKKNNIIYKKLNKLYDNKKIKTLLSIVEDDIIIHCEGKSITNIIDGNIEFLGGK